MGFFTLPRDLKWLFLSNFLWMFGSGLYFYTLPVYAADLGATPAQVGALSAIGFLAATIFLLPSGWLAERYERRAILIWAWWIGAIAGPVYLFANHWAWLIVGEVLNWGSMFAVTAVQAYTLGADTSGRPAYTLSVVFSSIPLGMVLSPWVGGQIAAHWGPRQVFLITTVVYMVSTLMLYAMRRQWPPPVPGAGQPAVPDPARPARRLNRKDLKVALLGWTTVGGAARSAALVVGAGQVLVALSQALGQLYIIDVTGAGYGLIGSLGSVASLGAALLGPLLGRLADRVSFLRAQQLGGVLMLVYAVILLAVPGVAWLVGLAFLVRGAMEGTSGLRAATVAAVARPHEMGRALSFANIAWGIFGTAGAYVGGWLYQSNQTMPFWLTAIGAVLWLVVLQLWLPRPSSPR